MSVPGGYELAKMRELEDVCRTMVNLPQVAAAIADQTAVVLTCPRGHKLTTVTLHLNGDGVMIDVRVIADKGRASGSAAVRDNPWSTSARRATRCYELGCGEVLDYDGWCPVHGGRRAVVIDPLDTRFTCPVCKPPWSDRVTTARLLRSIAAALVCGHPAASVTGSVARNR